MLMALDYLAEVQTKPTVEIEKKITHLLNYSATHPYAVTEYRTSYKTLHLYYGASHLSEPEAHIRVGRYFFLGPRLKNKTPILAMSK